jgi:hypothetical protein
LTFAYPSFRNFYRSEKADCQAEKLSVQKRCNMLSWRFSGGVVSDPEAENVVQKTGIGVAGSVWHLSATIELSPTPISFSERLLKNRARSDPNGQLQRPVAASLA